MAGLKHPVPRKPPRVFTFQWDDTRRRYTAVDEAGGLLGLSEDFNNAVGSAVREANLASREGSKVTVKVQHGSGALKIEYMAKPLRCCHHKPVESIAAGEFHLR